MKFNVGDIIIGTPESDDKYFFTNSSHKLRVVEVFAPNIKGDDIRVRMVGKGMIKSALSVKSKYFRLVTELNYSQADFFEMLEMNDVDISSGKEIENV